MFPGGCMSESVGGLLSGRMSLNAVALRNAVLCAECDVVSDSPHDQCMVCGSRSLINISRMLGGSLPKNRATVLRPVLREGRSRERFVTIPIRHKIRKRASRSGAGSGAGQLYRDSSIALGPGLR